MMTKLFSALLLTLGLLISFSEARAFHRLDFNGVVRPPQRNSLTTKQEEDVHFNKAAPAIQFPRGGGLLGHDKSFWIKFHGYVCFFQALHFTLESVGVPIPLIGLTATVKGMNATDPTTALALRMLASFCVMAGLTELDASTSPAVQKHFFYYHVCLSVATILGAMSASLGPKSYVTPVLAVFSLIAGLL